jgi:hypothetical protein
MRSIRWNKDRKIEHEQAGKWGGGATNDVTQTLNEQDCMKAIATKPTSRYIFRIQRVLYCTLLKGAVK